MQCRKKEIVELKEIVMELDAKAFVIVTDAREVLGEGFWNISIKNIHISSLFF